MNPLNLYSAAYVGVLILYIMDLLTKMVDSSNIAVSGSVNLDSIDPDDDYAIKQLSVIVDALENLGILSKDKQNCYMVDKISKQSQKLDANSFKIGIEFYVTHLQPSYIEKLNKSLHHQNAGDLSRVNTSSQSAQNNNTIQSVCPFVTIVDARKRLNNGTFAQDDNATVSNSHTNGNDPKKDWKEKLSHTQIMVIGTCTAVIGVFFIIAMIMRVRNYLKRKSKQERDSRGQFTSSLALQGSSHSPARTESLASKHGYPDSSKLSLSSNHNPHINTNGSLLNYHPAANHTGATDNKPLLAPPPDNKPLLVITSASAPSSPHTYASQPPNNNTKKKVCSTPSAPVEGSSSCRNNNKDYLTIDRLLPLNRSSTQQQPAHLTQSNTHHAKAANYNSKRHQNHKEKHKKKQYGFDMSFKDYFREPRSSDSSISESGQYQGKDQISFFHPQYRQRNQQEGSTSSRKDSSTSNQSGYETSISSITTDSSLPLRPPCIKYISYFNDNKNNKKDIIEIDDKNNNDDDNDDVFNENAISNKPIPPDNLPLSVLLPSNSKQREKRLSSSSSYGRKSVSFSLDVKVDDIDDSRDDISDDVLPDAETPADSITENSLLLRPEFLGMEPTYV